MTKAFCPGGALVSMGLTTSLGDSGEPTWPEHQYGTKHVPGSVLGSFGLNLTEFSNYPQIYMFIIPLYKLLRKVPV